MIITWIICHIGSKGRRKPARQNPQIEIATLKADLLSLKAENESLKTELSQQKKQLIALEESCDTKINKIFETQAANLENYDNKMEEMMNSFIHRFSLLLPGNLAQCQVPAKRGPLPSPPRNHKEIFNPSWCLYNLTLFFWFIIYVFCCSVGLVRAV